MLFQVFLIIRGCVVGRWVVGGWVVSGWVVGGWVVGGWVVGGRVVLLLVMELCYFWLMPQSINRNTTTLHIIFFRFSLMLFVSRFGYLYFVSRWVRD